MAADIAAGGDGTLGLSSAVEEGDDFTEGWSLPPEREAAEFDLEVPSRVG